MKLSDQFHTPAPLPLEKELPVLIRQEAGWAPQPEPCEEHNDLHLLLVLKPKLSSRAAKNLVTIP